MKITNDSLRISRADNGYIIIRDAAIDNGPQADANERWAHKTTHTVFSFGEEDALIQFVGDWTDNEPKS